MTTLDLAVVGNCSYGALLDSRGRVVWCCLPHFDRDPTFSALLGGDNPDGGFFEIEMLDIERSEQFYWRNSAVLETHLFDKDGNGVAIVDFAPRFEQYNRVFRPSTLVRRVRPIGGTPRICVRLRPHCELGTGRPERTRGSNHVRYVMPDRTLRLTTNAPISYIVEEVPFLLSSPIELVLGPDESIASSLADLAREFAERTDAYWRSWSRSLSIPFEWQDAVLRAAITLKLMSFEDTGAIIAALTTSIPEAPNSGRNWDYRYCWLRDSYFVVTALNRLGATQVMENYLDYIVNVVSSESHGTLRPVYGILRESDLPERKVDTLPGYRGMGPVRVGNLAAIASPERRLRQRGAGAVAELFRPPPRPPRRRAAVPPSRGAGRPSRRTLGQARCRHLGIPRHRGGPHPFGDAVLGGLRPPGADRRGAGAAGAGPALARARRRSCMRGSSRSGWNDKVGSFTSTFGGDDVDAGLLLMPHIGFIKPDDPRYLATLARIEHDLHSGHYLYRYAHPDDFGNPETAFIVCTFWYVEALAAVGRVDEARELFETLLAQRNHAGLLSEDIDVKTGQLWGNFPQTYSMVGLIRAATSLSRSWEGAF